MGEVLDERVLRLAGWMFFEISENLGFVGLGVTQKSQRCSVIGLAIFSNETEAVKTEQPKDKKRLFF